MEIEISDSQLLEMYHDTRNKLLKAYEDDIDSEDFSMKNYDFNFGYIEQLLKKAFIENDELPIRIENLKFNDSNEFTQISEKYSIVGEDTVVCQWDGSDGSNYYTSYMACSMKNGMTLITFLPVMTPRMSEIRPVVIQSLPMIIVVTILIILLATQVFARKIISPIQKLAYHADYVKKTGILEKEREIASGEDEIALLSQSLNSLYEQLNHNYEELEKSNLLLQEQNQRQEVFLRASSHQLKTPVAAAMLLVDGMIQKIGKYSDSETYLPKLKEQLKSMQKMIEDILYLSHCEGNMKMEPIQVEDILTACQTNYLIQLEEKNLTIEQEVTAVSMKTDGELLYKIIDNLISNAVKYADCGTKIRITLNKSGLCIHNRCEGILLELLPHIFEPFVSSETKEKGHGLGLYVVHYYSKLLGYQVEVKNVSDGVEAYIYFGESSTSHGVQV
ncbi:sensor histidine kinase [Anaerosporobacter sp.]